jgi:hypothetical protein
LMASTAQSEPARRSLDQRTSTHSLGEMKNRDVWITLGSALVLGGLAFAVAQLVAGLAVAFMGLLILGGVVWRARSLAVAAEQVPRRRGARMVHAGHVRIPGVRPTGWQRLDPWEQ